MKHNHGDRHVAPRLAAVLLTAALTAHPGQARAENITFPADAFGGTLDGDGSGPDTAHGPYYGNAFVSVKAYGAAGDGRHDDTEAVQAALDHVFIGMVYFPSGTYLVSRTIRWTYKGGGAPNHPWRSFFGQGEGLVTIKLRDDCPEFGDPAKPLPMIRTGGGTTPGQSEGSTAFANSLYHLTIDTGRGNPGAVGLSYYVSNEGALRHVTVRSGDGQGVAGIAYHGETGGLFSDVTVRGFGYGVDSQGGGYGPLVMDGVTVSGQTVAGLHPGDDPMTVNDLHSVNAVPALLTDGGGCHVTLLNSTIDGTAGSGPGVVHAAIG